MTKVPYKYHQQTGNSQKGEIPIWIAVNFENKVIMMRFIYTMQTMGYLSTLSNTLRWLLRMSMLSVWSRIPFVDCRL